MQSKFIPKLPLQVCQLGVRERGPSPPGLPAGLDDESRLCVDRSRSPRKHPLVVHQRTTAR